MKYLFVLLIVIGAVAGVVYLQGNINEIPDHGDNDEIASFEIHPSNVAKKIKSGGDFILLDVRTPEEYEEVHLEGAVLLPVESMTEESLDQIGLGADKKDAEIIVYCRSGARSQVAYNIMDSLGYTNVKSSAGGMIHWQEDGYPYTESGPYEGVLVGVHDEISITTGPKIVIDRELHDFGTVPQYGGTVETTFVVRNEGSEKLLIGELTTSCSCTSANISSSSIEPATEATLTVIFDPNLHEEPLGVFKRTVFIPTNDPNIPEVEVAISVGILKGE